MRNSLTIFLLKGLGAAVALFTVYFVTNTYGSVLLGKYSIVLTITLATSYLICFGGNVSIMESLASSKKDTSYLLS